MISFRWACLVMLLAFVLLRAVPYLGHYVGLGGLIFLSFLIVGCPMLAIGIAPPWGSKSAPDSGADSGSGKELVLVPNSRGELVVPNKTDLPDYHVEPYGVVKSEMMAHHPAGPIDHAHASLDRGNVESAVFTEIDHKDYTERRVELKYRN